MVKKNIISNIVGNVLVLIISLVFIPLYIRYLGIEAYGLIGFFTVLQNISALLDMGIGTSINREIARLSILPNARREMTAILYSMEIIGWITALSIGIVIIILSSIISNNWLQSVNLPMESINKSIILMGIAISFQWPLTLYTGGLTGLQHQLLFNLINVTMTLLRAGGAIAVFIFVYPSIENFLIWQIIANIMQTLMLRNFLWIKISPTDKKIFQWSVVKPLYKFGGGVAMITIVSFIASQIDKLILSKTLTLEMFGYYALAGVVATSFSRLIGPVVSAISPRFTQLIAIGDMTGLKHLYHAGCQIMSVLIIPAALFLAFFAEELLFIWTRNHNISQNASMFVFFLSISTLFYGLSHLPLSMQYSLGRTSAILHINIIVGLIMVPIIVLTAMYIGALAVTVVLMASNIIYAALIVRTMHRSILQNEKAKWYIKDVGIPFMISLVFLGIARATIKVDYNLFTNSAILSVIALFSLAATALSVPVTRNYLLKNKSNLQLKSP